MALDEYRRKRDFERTPEPSGRAAGERESDGRAFVVQKHDASRLHYDLRLEHGGVLLSWAVPKGPSLDPDRRRLAVHVEDHPLDYADFEGVIPKDEYGGGTVLLWDRGRWVPLGDPDEGLRAGKLSFTLHGEKLGGRWTLVRMDDEEADDRNWLLIKADDEAARADSDPSLAEQRPESVATGRSLDEVAAARDRIWTSSGGDEQGGSRPDSGPRPPDPSSLFGARPGRAPERPEPQLATRVDRPPVGDDWIHEVKLDGYRILAVVREGDVVLRTRRGNDWTSRFPAVAGVLADLPVREAVIDGEFVVLRPDGTTSFQALQRALAGSAADGRLVYHVFDLLHLDGLRLVDVPLTDRKDVLRSLLRAAGLVPADPGGAAPSGAIRYTDHVRGQGPSFFRQACRLALEGAVSKRASSRYRPGRNRDWRKSKCVERQDFVVGGFTEPSGARSGFGALLLGYYRPDGSLAYAGRVGTGFTEKTLGDLSERLAGIERDVPPFDAIDAADGGRDVRWVEPAMVVDVEFTEWTRDGVLRHPSFKGVREDMDPADVTRESPGDGEAPAGMESGGGDRRDGSSGPPVRPGGRGRNKATEIAGVRLTHPDRVLYPEQGITKRRLAEFYRDVGERMLPHVSGRPLTLLRCPKGRDAECFYQKHMNRSVPDAVGSVEIEEKEGRGRYLFVDSVAGLVALVQIGTLEIHPWGARIDRLERPDRIVFDLDPGPGVSWSRVVEAALELRERLDDLELESFVKTTGGKGLHVEVPLVRRSGWDEVKAFTRAIARGMASEAPRRYVARAARAERKGKIYVDYLRNSRGATAVAPYSPRARPDAPVAVPLRWDELGAGTESDRYTVDNVLRRLAALDADPWAGLSEVRQSITAPMRRAVGLGRR